MFITFSGMADPQGTKRTDLSYQYQNIRVKAKVLDAASREPIPGVTVYLIPQGDTVVTNFALSGEDGAVVLEKVASGTYALNAELLGYRTFTKEYEIYQAAGWDLDLGTIGMEESAESIDASAITAAGNPITIQNDTVIYHASSFRVGENAMLGDLLKKMPGIEVGEDGTATVNGEKVDRITVGGKTFFFGDPSMAIRNLPAKIVERIKVSRQDSPSAGMRGISTEIAKETVMDVELKEEYQEGWFGNARLGSGATLGRKDDDPFTEGTRLLYDGNAIASIYGRKDQAVFIGNAYNIQDAGEEVGSAGLTGLPEDDFTELGGLTAAIRGGANYNTDRIRNFETTVSAHYRHATKDDKNRYSRTSFVAGGANLLAEGGSDALGTEDQLVVDAELKKKNGRWLMDFSPRFYARKSSINVSRFSDRYFSTSSARANTSAASTFSDNRQLLASGSLGVTGKDLGKAGRKIGVSLNYSAGTSDGNRFENSLQTLRYDLLGNKLNLEGRLFYYEPLGPRWGFEAGLSGTYDATRSDRDAWNGDGGANDRYTHRADRRFRQEGADFLLEYRRAAHTVKAGLNAAAYNDVMTARLLGTDVVTGQGDWRFRWSPVAVYSFMKDGHSLSLQYTGTTKPVSGARMIPVPDLSDPVQVITGNTYLKSGIVNSLMAYYNMVNYTTYTFLTAYAYAEREGRGTVYASWFDNAGIRYAVPVNARKPGTNANVYCMLNQPFGKMKNFTLSLAGQLGYADRFGYQARSLQPGIDLDNFDYKAFMDGFWGDASGDRFYGGESGFAESRTRSFDWGFGVDLKYNKDFFTGTLSAGTANSRASYSLNPAAGMCTWTHYFGGELLFQPGKGWEFGSKVQYAVFRGYAAGYGKPELRWDMSLGKTIGSVTMGLKLHDLLDRERSLTRIVSAEYVEDAYRNVLGRTVLFSLSFNFGKLNANKTAAVSGSIKKLGY